MDNLPAGQAVFKGYQSGLTAPGQALATYLMPLY